jgi:two-component system OmpR family response regulator
MALKLFYASYQKQIAMTANSNKADQAPSRIKNVLLIEDEGEMCLLLNLILDNKDLQVKHVKTLADAAALLKKEQPDLIMLDNRLPDGFGFYFISYLKSTYPGIKIIMISGIDKAAGDSALEMGADMFLSKPFTKAILLQSVNKLLN